MIISAGSRIPPADIRIMGVKGPEVVDTADYFDHRTIVLFALPGAFTPTCSAKHLPGYIEHAQQIYDLGVDVIACLSVNDAYVMDAWGKSAGCGDIQMLADGNADLVTAMGLDSDSRAWGMGTRCRRFAMVVRDGEIEHFFLENPGEFRVSSAQHVLGVLQG